MDIHFAGFKSDTRKLGMSGWRIAEDRRNSERGADVRLLLRHDTLELEAMTHWMPNRDIFGRAFRSSVYEQHEYYFPAFTIAHIAPQIRVRYIHDHIMPAFIAREIDPTYTFADREQIYTFDTIFPTLRRPVNEVLMAKADMSVVDHLDAILRLQAPKQKELRAKQTGAETQPLLHLIQVA